MNSSEAHEIIDRYYQRNVHSEDETFEYTEALSYLITEKNDPRAMMELGGHYYELREFDLALKYYDMAAALDYEAANECLGYIWYYGRTGTKDYEKAFRYFSAAAKKGNIVARYKIADMYKNGYHVEKDYGKYKQIIRELYPEVRGAKNVFEPLPEIYTRLAHIEAEEGNADRAVDLYWDAKNFLAQRIRFNPFFGNLNIMKWLIEDLYKLTPADPSDMDLFDMYYWLLEPVEITFRYQGERYRISCVNEEGENVIMFGDKWFRNVDDFFKKAQIDGKLLTEINRDLYDFRRR